jgi:hypothetical protein
VLGMGFLVNNMRCHRKVVKSAALSEKACGAVKNFSKLNMMIKGVVLSNQVPIL